MKKLTNQEFLTMIKPMDSTKNLLKIKKRDKVNREVLTVFDGLEKDLSRRYWGELDNAINRRTWNIPEATFGSTQWDQGGYQRIPTEPRMDQPLSQQQENVPNVSQHSYRIVYDPVLDTYRIV